MKVWELVQKLAQGNELSNVYIVSGGQGVHPIGRCYLTPDLNLTIVPELESNFDVWGEDKEWPRADWKNEVANDETNQGYWEWVKHQRSLEEDGQSGEE